MKEPAWRLCSEEQYPKSWHTTVLTDTLFPWLISSMLDDALTTAASYNWKSGGAAALPLT